MGETNSQKLGWTGVVVVLIVVGAVVWLTSKAMSTYPNAKDAAAVLAVVISPLVGVGAATFGIKQSAESKAETKRVKKEAGGLADKLKGLIGGGIEVRGGDANRDPLAEVEAELRRLAE